MDLNQLLAISSNSRVFKNQKELLKTKFKASTMVGYLGGTFEITPTFLSYISYEITQGRTTELVVIDVYDNPILIPDLCEFYDFVASKYHEACNDFYRAYTHLVQNRKLENILT